MSNTPKRKRKLPPELKRIQKKLRKVTGKPVNLAKRLAE